MSDDLSAITAAAEKMFGAPVIHLASIPVRLMTETQVDWAGVVEEFRIPETQGATIGYAWPYVSPEGKPSFATVQKLNPPITRPDEAVLVWLAAMRKAHGANFGKPT